MGKQTHYTKAQVGIGTLIIFIAMVLVAAVAAAVLIQTSGVLQQRAAQTGTQTTTQVASGLEIVSIQGYDSTAPAADSSISRLAITVTPAAGTERIDLNEVVITLSNGTAVREFAYDSTMFVNKTNATAGDFDIFSTSTGPGNGTNYYVSADDDELYPADGADVATYGRLFGIVVLKDADSSLTATTPTLNAGDKVILTVNLATNGMGLSTRTTVTGTIKPEFGAPAVISFNTPSAYVDKVMTLQGT